MFNGIIAKCGIVKNILGNEKGLFLKISSDLKFAKKDIGSSVSCSGVCLTLTSINKKISTFYLSKETIKLSNFKNIKKGDQVNLEKSIKYGERISGHFVLGHVDGIAKVTSINSAGKSWEIIFYVKKKLKKYLVKKASIAINGVSLTISTITKNGFKIVVIPHTLRLTNLFSLKKNSIVNIEIDILSKYLKKYIK